MSLKQANSAPTTDTPLLETLQAVSVINHDEVAARAAQNISLAAAYTPGILSGMFGPSCRDDYFNLRGFDTRLFAYRDIGCDMDKILRAVWSIGSVNGRRYYKVRLLQFSVKSFIGLTDTLN